MGRGARNPHPEQLARRTDEIHTGEHEFRDAVVKEMLRLRPMLSLVGRRLKAPMDVSGVSLPGSSSGPGTTLMVVWKSQLGFCPGALVNAYLRR